VPDGLWITAADRLFGKAVVAEPDFDMPRSLVEGVEVQEIRYVSQRIDQRRPDFAEVRRSNVGEKNRITQ
jgi:hypothetical protein